MTDGQLNVEAYGAAAGSRLNGLEITPILLGPVGLKVADVNADPAAPSVALEWDAEPGLTWNVYRSSPFDSKPVLVGSVDAPAYTDTSARVGLAYTYHVTAVDQTALESVPSKTVEVSLVDEAVSAPAAPTALTVDRIEKRELELSWAAPVGAEYHLVFRSEREGERGELVGITPANRYTDATVLTTIPYYYTVVAVSAGGSGAASAQLKTEAVTVLQRQAEYLDRAPSAVQTDSGVLVAWRFLGTDPDGTAFHVYRDGKRITGSPITDSSNLLDEDGTADIPLFRHEGAERSRDDRDRRVRRAHGGLPLGAARQARGRLHEGRPALHVHGERHERRRRGRRRPVRALRQVGSVQLERQLAGRLHGQRLPRRLQAGRHAAVADRPRRQHPGRRPLHAVPGLRPGRRRPGRGHHEDRATARSTARARSSATPAPTTATARATS